MVGRASYRYRITDGGRARAVLFLEDNHYVGVAPVPVAEYRRYMSQVKATMTTTHTHITRSIVPRLGSTTT